MHFVIIALIVAALIFGPSIWAKRTFTRYSRDINDMPGTGGELARHLLDKYDMKGVKVEVTQQGDHYDPAQKVVRLSESNFNGKSLTAIAVAAHEVGHAIQDKQNSSLLKTRTRLIKTAQLAEKAGSIAMLAIPFVTVITKAPSTGLLMFLAGFGSILISTLVHLVTLPVELDASFGKALPVLKEGGYIQKQHEAAINKVLKAAAFTYVAQSLSSLLNLARWIAILRRR